MGREVRMVPANWEHPLYSAEEVAVKPYLAGRHKALLGGSFAADVAEWDEGEAKWDEGLRSDWNGGWQPIEPEYFGMSFSDWAGERPVETDYMPGWPEEERTHLMMYENTSEGTPISPAFATPEELARWLADNHASTFADMTATYDQWLSMIKRGWAPSAIMDAHGFRSGVEALAEDLGS